jgi:acyl-CoA synthetase (AMP-forming)/AMP-acid ligase II
MIDTLDAVLRQRAVDDPAKAMVIDPVTRIGYAELDADTLALAARLIAAGVSKGSRIGLLAPNGCDWVRIASAVMRIGAVLVPLSTLLSARELAAQLHTASVQYLICVEEFRGNRYLESLGPSDRPPSLRQVWRADKLDDLPTGDTTRASALAATVRPADPLAIIFTSGSSGPPKGVIHSHGNAFGAVRSGLAARCITPDTRLYLPMPFFWVGGFGAGVLSALLAGATLVTEPIPEPSATLALLAREQVNLFRGWPDQAAALARHASGSPSGVVPRARGTATTEPSGSDLSRLRVGSLEALLPPELRSAPGARANLFGMTETFGPYFGYPADTDMPESAWGSCGKPFDGMEVRIADPDTSGLGMIEVRGPHVMRGICRRSREEVFTADGFYRTGDLGRLNPEGFLFYHGRGDDMFKVKGATVYPSEVVDALRTIPGVAAAAVTNVTGPRGNKVGALVVCDAGITVDQLRSATRKVLSAFKVPTVWSLIGDADAIPRGGTGKVDVNRLRQLLAQRPVDD